MALAKALGAVLVLLSIHAGADVTVDSHPAQITVVPTGDDNLRVQVELGGTTHELQLHLSKDLLHPEFVLGLLQEDGTVIPQPHEPTRCHYTGVVEGAEASIAAISVCDGIVEGFFDVAGTRSMISSAAKLSEVSAGSVQATVQRASLHSTQARLQNTHIHHKEAVDYELPTTAEPSSATATDRRQLASCAEGAVVTKCCADSSCDTCVIDATTPKVVEVSLVTDKPWNAKYGPAANTTTNRAITIFNQAAALYLTDGFSPRLSLQLRSLTVLPATPSAALDPPAVECNCQEAACPDNDYSSDNAPVQVDAVKYNSDVFWPLRRNMSASMAGDTTVVLSGYDLAQVQGDSVCLSPVGWASFGWICSEAKSTSVNEDLGSTIFAAETVAHEIGHVLGALHDGDSDNDIHATWYAPSVGACPTSGFVMAALSDPNGARFTQWSDCSTGSINALMSTPQACCLQQASTPAADPTAPTAAPTTPAPTTPAPTTSSPTAAPTSTGTTQSPTLSPTWTTLTPTFANQSVASPTRPTSAAAVAFSYQTWGSIVLALLSTALLAGFPRV